MAQPTIQTSFAAGEWAPKLRSRVDIQKYHSGASLLRNFYVDFSGGGASTRPGTRYVQTVRTTSQALPVRLISFQPSTDLSYVLEFGQNYIRFYHDGAPIVEDPLGATLTAPNTFNVPSNSTNVTNPLVAGDWIQIVETEEWFIIVTADGDTITTTDLYGVPAPATAPATITIRRQYTISSPYQAADLFPDQITRNPGLKFVQDVTSMILTHINYVPYILTINSATDWTLVAINFGPLVQAPVNPTATTTGGGPGAPTTPGTAVGTWNYGYIVTAEDINNRESGASQPALVSSGDYIGQTMMSNTITWAAVPGATSYNVYKAQPLFDVAIPVGAPYGFIGNTRATTFVESFPGIQEDFSQTPPILYNPFAGAAVGGLNLTANGEYTAIPTVTIDPPTGTGGTQASGAISLTADSATISNPGAIIGAPSPVGMTLTFPNGQAVMVTDAVEEGLFGNLPGWGITGVQLTAGGSFMGAPGTPVPTNPIDANAPIGGYQINLLPSVSFTWNVGAIILVQGGSGYETVPNVTITPGPATATAFLQQLSAGNPGVPGFVQERLVLAGQQRSLQSFNMSKPGDFFNYDYSNPSEPDDGISGSIISEELNDIRWLIPVPTGIIAGTSAGAWLLNGGSGIATMSPITPTSIEAQPQAFNGANDLRPQKVNFDVIYGTNKGSYFRDLTYNIYINIYTGQDISVLSNHLFLGYGFVDICWSEEPFKTMWFVRNDGVLLSLGFVKEQELIGWSHHDTNGTFKSCCSAIELVGNTVVDAVYVVVEREVNGQFMRYIERFDDRIFIFGAEDSWSVDAGLRTVPSATPTSTLYVTGISTLGNTVTLTDLSGTFTAGLVGSTVRAYGGVYSITAFMSTTQVQAKVVRPAIDVLDYTGQPAPIRDGYEIWTNVTEISNLTHLKGRTVTGLIDGKYAGMLVVDDVGSVTLPFAGSKIVLGIKFTPQLQTLPLDLGEPTAQSKRKKLPALTLRVADTLGLAAGTGFNTLVRMKDAQLGAIPSTSNGVVLVTDLVSGDIRTVLDQLWQEIGVICIEQDLPYPATILGVIPEVSVGDTPR